MINPALYLTLATARRDDLIAEAQDAGLARDARDRRPSISAVRPSASASAPSATNTSLAWRFLSSGRRRPARRSSP
jgi:hypothetical protein